MAPKVETGATVGDQFDVQDKPEGPIAAAVIASGVGVLALGVFTTLAEMSTSIRNLLNIYDPVGPLSGKTVYAVVVWLVAWGVLLRVYRDKGFETRKTLTLALIGIALGTLGTFPVFFEAFAPAG
jgi:hypothetical protein